MCKEKNENTQNKLLLEDLCEEVWNIKSMKKDFFLHLWIFTLFEFLLKHLKSKDLFTTGHMGIAAIKWRLKTVI